MMSLAPWRAFVRSAADDAYDRLIQPSMEREIRNTLTDQANEGAIHMFALNLRPLLMQPPVKGRVTRFADDHVGDAPAQFFDQLHRHLLSLPAGGAVADGNVLHPVLPDRGRQPCLPLPAPAGVRPYRRHRQKPGEVPGGERGVHHPEAAPQGAQAGPQGL